MRFGSQLATFRADSSGFAPHSLCLREFPNLNFLRLGRLFANSLKRRPEAPMAQSIPLENAPVTTSSIGRDGLVCVRNLSERERHPAKNGRCGRTVVIFEMRRWIVSVFDFCWLSLIRLGLLGKAVNFTTSNSKS